MSALLKLEKYFAVWAITDRDRPRAAVYALLKYSSSGSARMSIEGFTPKWSTLILSLNIDFSGLLSPIKL